MKGRINKIIPMSLVDGPGNRTSIFFQGCNFNCAFCHNPETINHCIHCGDCVGVCPTGALSQEGGKVSWDPQACIGCDACLGACSHDSSPKISSYSPKELADLVEKNIPFISGVTVSGGESSLQYQFIRDFFEHVHGLGLNCLVDTNGGLDFSQPDLRDFVDQSDGFMLDVKAWDPEDHRKITGRPIDPVLKNLAYLYEIKKLEEIRCLCLSTIDNEKTLQGISQVLKGIRPGPLPRLKLIQFRQFGVREAYKGLSSPGEDEMKNLEVLAKKLGFQEVILI